MCEDYIWQTQGGVSYGSGWQKKDLDDTWNIIKSYHGFHQYYTLPAERKKKLVNTAFSEYFDTKCYNTLFDITQAEVHLCLCLLKAFVFLIDYNDWVQCARRGFKHWDVITAGIATKCNDFLAVIDCGCNECENCFTHNSLDRISKMFYSVYMEGVKSNRP